MSVIRPLVGHTSPETAYLIADYPYGRKLRCQRRVWIEHSPSHGFRFVAQTTNPKTGRWNTPHKSTYSEIAMGLYLDEQGHVQSMAVTAHANVLHALSFAREFGRQAEGAGIFRVFALKKARYLEQLANGEAYFTINGKREETSPAETERNLAESKQWLEVAELLNPERLGKSQ